MLFFGFKALMAMVLGMVALTAIAISGGHCRRDVDRFRDHAVYRMHSSADDWRHDLRESREELRRSAREAREEFRRSRDEARDEWRRSREEVRDELHRAMSEVRRSLRDIW